MDTVTPLFVAVAWSRRKLPVQQQQFDLKLGGYEQLHLVGMTHRDPTFQQIWGPAVGHVLSNAQLERLYLGSLTASINRFIGFSYRESEFPFKELGEQYYGSFLN